MTSDEATDGLRDRIRYWESICDRAQSSEYIQLRALAYEAGTFVGTGPKTEDKVRRAIRDRAKKRLDTLYGELGARMMGTERRGLRW